MSTCDREPAEKPKMLPAVVKLLEVENNADSGLADSREMTPDMKIVKFSPLVRTREIGKDEDTSTEEINFSNLSDPENPNMQSSGMNPPNEISPPDISTIEKGLFHTV